MIQNKLIKPAHYESVCIVILIIAGICHYIINVSVLYPNYVQVVENSKLIKNSIKLINKVTNFFKLKLSSG